MSRIANYKSSIIKFISSLTNSETIEPIVKEHYESATFWISIFCLTLINNNNKKNNTQVHGYYLAACIEFIIILSNLSINKQYMITKYGVDKYYKFTLELTMKCHSLLNNHLQMAKIINTNIHESLNDVVSKITSSHTFNTQKYNNINKILRYNFSNEQIKKIKKLNQLTQESYDLYFNNFILPIFTITNDFVMLCNKNVIVEKNNINLMIFSKFSNITKIVDDFYLLFEHLENATSFSTNYILNFGIEESFNLYTLNKQKFIHLCMENNMYTNTVSDILKNMDCIIDEYIENTSPDLKSET